VAVPRPSSVFVITFVYERYGDFSTTGSLPVPNGLTATCVTGITDIEWP